MSAVRRVYVYVVVFAALAALGLGVANLVRALLETWIGTAQAQRPGYLQDQVALWGAAALVGLPTWALHWLWAERLCIDPAERASTLRRLFLYAVLAGAMLVAFTAVRDLIAALVAAVVGPPVALASIALPTLPLAVVATAVWIYHWSVATRDRAAVDEVGASATLRRWYLHGVSFFAFLDLLAGAQLVLMWTWLLVTAPVPGFAPGMPGAADALVGVGVWALHWTWLPRTMDATSRARDRRSTLRGVYLFLVLAVALLATLSGISQILYYSLGRLLGVSAPGGVTEPLARAAAGPSSAALVYGGAWLFQRRMIGGLEHELDAPGQVRVRLLYEYLTALIALGVLSVGVAGLLWILGDVVSRAPETLGTTWWQDRLALFATVSIVGLPVWLLHWQARAVGHAPSPVRRIYLFVVLTVAVLGLLGSGATSLYRVLSLVLGLPDPSTAITDLAHAAGIAIVAAAVAAYHWRMVRLDMRDTRPVAPADGLVTQLVELSAPSSPALDSALQLLQERGITVRRRAM